MYVLAHGISVQNGRLDALFGGIQGSMRTKKVPCLPSVQKLLKA